MGAVVAAALASSCATIKSETVTTDTPTRTVEKLEAPTAPPTLTGSAKVQGTALAVRLQQAQACELKTMKMVNRVELVKKTSPTFSIAASVLGGAALAGVGAWMFFDADGWASRGSASSNGMTTKLTGADVRVAGIVVASTSLIPFAIALIDAIRSIDTKTDMGEVVASTDTKMQACNEKPVAEQLARVGIEGAPSTRTNAEGVATFQYKDAPVRALPREKTPVQVGDMTTMVELASDELAALGAALKKDPTSAVAIEERATRERSCKDLLRSAIDARATDREADDEAAARRWEAAQQACGELWTPQAAAARARFDEAFGKRKVERQRRACKTAFDAADTALTQGGANTSEAVDAATTACEGQVSTAPLNARLQESRASEAKKTLVAQERENVLEALHQRAFEAALRKLRRTPDVCFAPRAGQDNAFVRILDQAVVSATNPVIGAVAAGREPDATSVQQLCLARTFFIECQGQETWRRAVAAMTGGVAKVDPLKTGKVVKALNSGTCAVGGTP